MKIIIKINFNIFLLYMQDLTEKFKNHKKKKRNRIKFCS